MNTILIKLYVTWPTWPKVHIPQKFEFSKWSWLFLDWWRILFLIRLKVSKGGTLVTMPVKYLAPKVTVKLWFFILEITVVKIMNNLNICPAHSYLYPRSRFTNLLIWYVCISSQNDKKKSIFDLVLHCICMTVVPCTKVFKDFPSVWSYKIFEYYQHLP